MDRNGTTVKYKTLRDIVPALFKANNVLPKPLGRGGVMIGGVGGMNTGNMGNNVN